MFGICFLYQDYTDKHETKRTAITRMLGTDRWEQELYSTSSQMSLFGNSDPARRNTNVAGLENYVRERLNEIFPKVLRPLALPVVRRPQMFSLFFAISNPDPRAIGLATRIADHILSSGSSSQVRP
jgi:hypothetical protein